MILVCVSNADGLPDYSRLLLLGRRRSMKRTLRIDNDAAPGDELALTKRHRPCLLHLVSFSDAASLLNWREIHIENLAHGHPLDSERIVNLHLDLAARCGLAEADIFRELLIVLWLQDDRSL
jgi:hypothetical protein